MNKDDTLQRFIKAQESDYEIVLSEIKKGRKRSHWMWYIFPQIAGLGYSETSKYYAIKNKKEAEAYLAHPVLCKRLVNICEILLQLADNNARNIFGSPDDVKLKSCVTLFALLPDADPVFKALLQKFFHGVEDEETVRILSNLS